MAEPAAEEMPRYPVATITGVVKLIEPTTPTAERPISGLEKVGIIV